MALAAARCKGVVLHVRGEHQHAVETLQMVHAAQIKTLGDAHPDTLSTAWRLGEALLVTDVPSALETLRCTAAQQSTVLGSEHPNVLRTETSLGHALASMGGLQNVAEANQILERCESLQLAMLNEEHPDLAKTMALKVMLGLV